MGLNSTDMNTFGYNLRLTTFGESHGVAMGGVLDGMPSRVKINTELIQEKLDKRKPGKGGAVSSRNENDKIEILSGLSSKGETLGSPIGFIIRNNDFRPEDYEGLKNKFRPNHADYTYYTKYGIHDFNGGGRSSARETVNWVAAGAIVAQWLSTKGISLKTEFIETADIKQALLEGNSVGGTVKGSIYGLPVGLGEPVFDKFHSRLAAAMMSINAAKAFEYGDGVVASSSLGSEVADLPYVDSEGNVKFRSNHSGGVQGGITNGMPVEFRVHFKPTPSIPQPLQTLDVDLNQTEVCVHGRHDACVALRAVPVVEAMAWLTIGDMLLSRIN